MVSGGLRWCVLISSSISWSPLISAGLQFPLLGLKGLCRCLLVSNRLRWFPLVFAGLNLSAVFFSCLCRSPLIVLVSRDIFFLQQSLPISSSLCWSSQGFAVWQWCLLLDNGLCWSPMVSVCFQCFCWFPVAPAALQ